MINHKNSNRIDNRPKNIEWATGKENHDHGVKYGYKSKWGDKPVYQYNKKMKLIGSYNSVIQASKALKLSAGNISIAARGIWTHYKGYIWSYKQIKTKDDE